MGHKILGEKFTGEGSIIMGFGGLSSGARPATLTGWPHLYLNPVLSAKDLQKMGSNAPHATGKG